MQSSRCALVFAVVAAASCAPAERLDPAEEPYDGPPLPWAWEPFPATPFPIDDLPSPARIELGLLLFYDPVLSRDRATACATCHSEIWGMSDGLPVSIGVDGEGPTGPGRTGPNQTTRNAQTLWNVALRPSLFWDGRSTSLEEQALLPIENAHELALDLDALVERLQGIDEYVRRFRRAFPAEPGGITTHQVARALAAFERTLITNRAPYDAYVDGDEGAITGDARRGMWLFAEGGCDGCHVPPLFDSERYAARIATNDAGRAEITNNPDDRGAFRVPTLRNLRESGPYFHDGSVATIEEAVRLEARRSADEGHGRALSDDEVELVAAFLHKSLMDRSREPTRPDHVPSELGVPIDGFRIPR